MRHRLREQFGKVDLDPREVQVGQTGKEGDIRQVELQAVPVALQLVPVPTGRLPIRLGGTPLRQDGCGKENGDDDEHGSNHGFASSDSCTTSRSERR